MLKLHIQDYVDSFKTIPKPCWRGILLGFIESSLLGIYYFFSIYFVDTLHFNTSTAGIIISFFGLGTILGGWAGGKLCDKISADSVIILGLLGQAVSIYFIINLKTFSLLIIDVFMLGTATYFFITANYVSTLQRSHESEKSKLQVISMLNVASNLGISCAAMIIGICSVYSFRPLFMVSCTLLFLCSVILFIIKYRTTNNTVRQYATNTYGQQHLKSTNISPSLTKQFYLVLICLFFTGMITSQLSATYPIFLKDTFPLLGVKAYSFLFTLMTILVVLFQNYFTILCSGKNKMFMIGMGSFLIGSGMLLLNLSFAYFIAVIACIIYSIGEMIFYSMVQLYCYQQSGERDKGKALGVYRAIYATSRFVGPATGGYIFHHLGGAMVWYFSGIIGTLFFLLCNINKRPN